MVAVAHPSSPTSRQRGVVVIAPPAPHRRHRHIKSSSSCKCLIVSLVLINAMTLYYMGGGGRGGRGGLLSLSEERIDGDRENSEEVVVAHSQTKTMRLPSSGGVDGLGEIMVESSPSDIPHPPPRGGRGRRAGGGTDTRGEYGGILGREDESQYDIAARISSKWNLSSPHAPKLLEMQFHRKLDDYDPRTDFLHYHHIAKTGGTSISDLMNATLGTLAHGRNGILPGSHRSGEFNPNLVFNVTMTNTTMASDFPYLASYAHARLRPLHGPNRTDLAAFFTSRYFANQNVPRRRLRSLAMIREPMDLRASAYAMAICSLNGRVNEHNAMRRKRGLGRICTPEMGLNISALWDVTVMSASAKCHDSSTRLDRYDKFLCKRGPSAMDFCRGPTRLLSSVQYRDGMRNMYRGLMGRYTSRERMFAPALYSLSDPDEHPHSANSSSSSAAAAVAPSSNTTTDRRSMVEMDIGEVERYTLLDLGGLGSNIDHAPCVPVITSDGATHEVEGCVDDDDERLRQSSSIDGGSTDDIDGGSEPDFLWFGITERMQESICLYYYSLGVMPLKRAPRARIMDCPPTSWWTEEHREEVRRLEPYDYAVWRAANAILDVRTIVMREEVRRKMAENTTTREERERYAALDETGCLG